MARTLRFIPEEGALVEVTCRTMRGRYLFRPSPELNEIIRGILGYAQALHNVRICLVTVLSSHFHLLLDIDNAKQLSQFMHFVNSHLAKEVNRLTGWSGPVFAKRYTAILVSKEEDAQVERLRYGLANSTKEGLVEKPQDWPGVHSVDCLLDDVPMTGRLFSRTQEYAARRRGEDFERYEYATEVTVQLAPLPCWKHLSADQRKVRIASLVRDIEAEAAAARKATGSEVVGAEAVMSKDPHHRPEKLDRSPAPRFHTATREAWRELREAYHHFLAAFRTAADKLKAGDRASPFPVGSFPPALPFVAA
ncbi:MAG TPA: hypothetical protein VLE27_07635 [Thermoanaerobaculia bacterium]|nr:hypothetical protein [Thermoanaerobaculia bacterium]